MYTQDNLTDMINYRPVTVLLLSSKVFNEITVYDRLKMHINRFLNKS